VLSEERLLILMSDDKAKQMKAADNEDIEKVELDSCMVNRTPVPSTSISTKGLISEVELDSQASRELRLCCRKSTMLDDN
jgi:hypothetical protein